MLAFRRYPGEIRNNTKQWIFYDRLRRAYVPKLNTLLPPKEQSPQKASNIIWWCWLQGEKNAPDICKKGLESIRKWMPDKQIIILTNENISHYVHFPAYIMKAFNDGNMSQAHYSDLLRIELLTNYGGIWIDSTVFLTKRPIYAEHIPLFVFQEAERGNPACVASNWFISAEAHNPIIELTRNLLFDYWKHHHKVFHYFFFHFFFHMATDYYKKEWNAIPFFSNLPCHIMQRELFHPYTGSRWNQLEHMSDVHKLTYKYNSSMTTEGTILQHILNGESNT